MAGLLSVQILLLFIVIYFLFVYFRRESDFMHWLDGQKEQLVFSIPAKGAKDRNTWETDGVKDFEICLSSCHCSEPRTNMQRAALDGQAFCMLGHRSLQCSAAWQPGWCDQPGGFTCGRTDASPSPGGQMRRLCLWSTDFMDSMYIQ